MKAYIFEVTIHDPDLFKKRASLSLRRTPVYLSKSEALNALQGVAQELIYYLQSTKDAPGFPWSLLRGDDDLDSIVISAYRKHQCGGRRLAVIATVSVEECELKGSALSVLAEQAE